MNKIKFILALLGITSLFADNSKMVEVNKGIEIWYETFGQNKNPACLLVMGAGGQGIYWSTDFCQKLAHKGFYVIRYDQRDTGSSTGFDYEKTPYTLLDMAKDGIALLDTLKVKKAHVVGLSMGGPIAQLISVHDPKRVQSVALIATSPDFRPFNRSMTGLPLEKDSLSGPQASYLEAMAKLASAPPPATKEEQQAQQTLVWKILNGNGEPLEETTSKEVQERSISRPTALKNHMLAIKASESLISEVPHKVKVRTVIFQGMADPIFGPDHGEALARMIKGSKYYPVRGMGHVLNTCFVDFMIEKIAQNAKAS